MLIQYEFEQHYYYLSEGFEWEVYIIPNINEPFHMSNVKAMYGGNSEFWGHRQFLRCVFVKEPETWWPIQINVINL